jgi:hypothetical protein
LSPAYLRLLLAPPALANITRRPSAVSPAAAAYIGPNNTGLTWTVVPTPSNAFVYTYRLPNGLFLQRNLSSVCLQHVVPGQPNNSCALELINSNGSVIYTNFFNVFQRSPPPLPPPFPSPRPPSPPSPAPPSPPAQNGTNSSSGGGAGIPRGIRSPPPPPPNNNCTETPAAAYGTDPGVGLNASVPFPLPCLRVPWATSNYDVRLYNRTENATHLTVTYQVNRMRIVL